MKDIAQKVASKASGSDARAALSFGATEVVVLEVLRGSR